MLGPPPYGVPLHVPPIATLPPQLSLKGKFGLVPAALPKGLNLAQKLIHSHLVDGRMVTGDEIGIRIDQTLTQDATGTMVMLELEAMGIDQARTELSAQYVDHNLIQEDFKNPDDHSFTVRAAASESGSAGPATASATPFTRSVSVHRVRPFWGPTAIRLRSVPSVCLQ